MNTIHILDELETAINSRDKSHKGQFCICWLAGKIQCILGRHASRAERTFAWHRDSTLEAGLTSDQWNRLETAIRKFVQEKSS